MKSADSRTNSKYKSPYGCRTNSHCVINKLVYKLIACCQSTFQTIDNLLRCSICYEYFDVAMIVPDCSHNCELLNIWDEKVM